MKKLRSCGTIVLMLAAVVVLTGALAPAAQAITLLVPSQYATITDAINATVTGDTVQVAAGTYNENLVIDKAITVQGAGSEVTVIDGTSTSLALTGLVRITAIGDVTFSGFTVQGAGQDPGFVRVGIYASSPSAGVTYTISNNKIIGSGNPDDDEDYGFYSNGGLESLVFVHNEVSQTGSNAILLERHYGPTDVSDNVWDRGVSNNAVDPYFNMNYDGPDITTAQKVSHNTINMGTGNPLPRGFAITFAASFTGVPGGFTNIWIGNNEVINATADRKGIGLWNNAASQVSGGCVGTRITHNTVSGTVGAAPSIGVRLLGFHTGTRVTNNTFNTLDIGVQLREWSGGDPLETTLTANRYNGVTTSVNFTDTSSSDTTLRSRHEQP